MNPSEIGPEITAFLESQRNLVLGTLRKDGSPQASPVWYLWNGDAFVISTITATAKWWNLKRDPRASICVDDPATGQMVIAYGDAILELDDIWDRTRDLVAKYYLDDPDQVDPHMESIFEGQTRVLITVKPDNLITRSPDE
ncbi:MAG: PPOX class F420-dependent oxidoreductase [Chloroflexi bacterium]|jgi:PPOX class probable F420-dependent enzyme|nr:PPOX class F420-dependent oxidoreductase [Chloroflexota bacterium]MBT4072949.1 PPOX class F420-dependent oxidoreductase [Chloroflexota bacterium]MBT4515740.1 PPOX class F420-dependent oxidoreductase [Chloroflexota bacterium]MBT6682294.1 PPOX class F420-dependent oxidoreductase [Chloroflexota bacterium]